MAKRYHINLDQTDIQGAQYAVIPGDPGRSEILAKAIDPNAVELSNNREFHSYLADLQGHKIVVCSTGIGGPAASIALEELAEIGIVNFLRVGTTGAIQPQINVGDIVITKAAVRIDGTSEHYAPIEYPAVASFSFTESVKQACQECKAPFHVGVTASSASFYSGQERYDSFKGFVPRRFRGSLDEWQHLNVLNYEMESATVLTAASAMGLRAACFCAVVVNRTQGEAVALKPFDATNTLYAQVMRQALLLDLARQSS